MRPFSESKALQKLDTIRAAFRNQITNTYEHRARPCSACVTPGACCLDAHFVNVRITRLEAVAIRKALQDLPRELREKIFTRINKIAGLMNELTLERYACPLFENEIGCLVHDTAKPLPCIIHACYERKEDLPPDELLTEREIEIDKLNRRVYGKVTFLPIPLAVENAEA